MLNGTVLGNLNYFLPSVFTKLGWRKPPKKILFCNFFPGKDFTPQPWDWNRGILMTKAFCFQVKISSDASIAD